MKVESCHVKKQTRGRICEPSTVALTPIVPTGPPPPCTAELGIQFLGQERPAIELTPCISC